jgi:hypothetical protein
MNGEPTLTLSAERKVEISKRLFPLLVTELKKIREGSGNAGGGSDPRATLKSRFDSGGGTAHVALMTTLTLDEGVISPSEFNEMVDFAAEQL